MNIDVPCNNNFYEITILYILKNSHLNFSFAYGILLYYIKKKNWIILQQLQLYLNESLVQ